MHFEEYNYQVEKKEGKKMRNRSEIPYFKEKRIKKIKKKDLKRQR